MQCLDRLALIRKQGAIAQPIINRQELAKPVGRAHAVRFKGNKLQGDQPVAGNLKLLKVQTQQIADFRLIRLKRR